MTESSAKKDSTDDRQIRMLTHLGKGGSPYLAWFIPILAIVIAVGSAFAIERLNETVDKQREAQVVLALMEEDLALLQILEEEAIDEENVSPETAEEIEEEGGELKEGLDYLLRSNLGDDTDLAPIREAIDGTLTALDEELRLIEAGKLEQAKLVREERVERGFDTLDERAEDFSAKLERSSERTNVIADVVTYAVTLLAATVLIAMFWFYERELRSYQAGLRKAKEAAEVPTRGREPPRPS